MTAAAPIGPLMTPTQSNYVVMRVPQWASGFLSFLGLTVGSAVEAVEITPSIPTPVPQMVVVQPRKSSLLGSFLRAGASIVRRTSVYGLVTGVAGFGQKARKEGLKKAVLQTVKDIGANLPTIIAGGVIGCTARVTMCFGVAALMTMVPTLVGSLAIAVGAAAVVGGFASTLTTLALRRINKDKSQINYGDVFATGMIRGAEVSLLGFGLQHAMMPAAASDVVTAPPQAAIVASPAVAAGSVLEPTAVAPVASPAIEQPSAPTDASGYKPIPYGDKATFDGVGLKTGPQFVVFDPAEMADVRGPNEVVSTQLVVTEQSEAEAEKFRADVKRIAVSRDLSADGSLLSTETDQQYASVEPHHPMLTIEEARTQIKSVLGDRQISVDQMHKLVSGNAKDVLSFCKEQSYAALHNMNNPVLFRQLLAIGNEFADENGLATTTTALKIKADLAYSYANAVGGEKDMFEAKWLAAESQNSGGYAERLNSIAAAKTLPAKTLG